MDYDLRYYKGRKIDTHSYDGFVLSGDVGGTNTNLGVSGIHDSNPKLLFSLHFQSQALRSLSPAVKEVLRLAKEKHDINVSSACIAAAGPVSDERDYCTLTNVKWNVDARALLKKTPLESLFIINDFEAIGYGINLLDPKNEKDIVVLRHGKRPAKKTLATKAVIGAGTGFGKCILVYDPDFGIYVPVASEGGHADFPAQDEEELALIEYIQKKRKNRNPVSYEDVLSGRGIEAIYGFLRSGGKFKQTRFTREIDACATKCKEFGMKSRLISKYRTRDKTCEAAFRMYTDFYARTAKDFVLDSLAKGGVYIAGGIASRNPDIFKARRFISEFENANKQRDILKDTPIYIVVNYNVSLYGAGLAALKRHDLAIMAK